MFFTSIAFSLLLAITTVSASPLHKRYTNVLIRSYRTNTCLTAPPGVQIIDGTLLTTGNCATATRWDINPGNNLAVRVTGTQYVLDAGINPSNNVPAKVWTSYPGTPQQTWWLTGDNRIAITGGNQCLDEGPSGPQTYQCTTGNTNQIWYIDGAVPPPSSSSSAPPPSSTSSAPPPPSSSAPPPGGRQQLKWQGNTNLCATVQGGVANGTPVNMVNCFNPTSPSANNQVWSAVSGLIQLTGTNFCLDAGIGPSNGVQMKIWQCYVGAPQQTWSFLGNGLIQTQNNQCLNLANENFSKLQTWACSNPDPQEKFVLS